LRLRDLRCRGRIPSQESDSEAGNQTNEKRDAKDESGQKTGLYAGCGGMGIAAGAIADRRVHAFARAVMLGFSEGLVD